MFPAKSFSGDLENGNHYIIIVSGVDTMQSLTKNNTGPIVDFLHKVLIGEQFLDFPGYNSNKSNKDQLSIVFAAAGIGKKLVRGCKTIHEIANTLSLEEYLAPEDYQLGYEDFSNKFRDWALRNLMEECRYTGEVFSNYIARNGIIKLFQDNPSYHHPDAFFIIIIDNHPLSQGNHLIFAKGFKGNFYENSIEIDKKYHITQLHSKVPNSNDPNNPISDEIDLKQLRYRLYKVIKYDESKPILPISEQTLLPLKQEISTLNQEKFSLKEENEKKNNIIKETSVEFAKLESRNKILTEKNARNIPAMLVLLILIALATCYYFFNVRPKYKEDMEKYKKDTEYYKKVIEHYKENRICIPNS